MTLEPAEIALILLMHQKIIISHSANTFDSTFLIYQLTITPGPARIGLILLPDWP